MDSHLRLTEKDTICPHCYEEYQSLSRHWGHKPSHRPSMDYLHHSMAAGLVLGGCKIDADSQTPTLDIRTQYPVFAIWLYENLGWLANTIHRSAPGQRQSSPTYIVRTVPHPELDRYRRWRAGDDRPSATETIHSPYTVRVWVAKTAGVGWSGQSNSRTTRFHAETDARHRWYGAVLDYLGYEPYDSGVRYELDQSESCDLLDRIGEPVPGVKHKWEFDRDEYRASRRAKQLSDDPLAGDSITEGALGHNPRSTEAKYTDRDKILALREAATDGTLSSAEYENWHSSVDGDVPSRTTICWEVWRPLAGLERPETTQPTQWTKSECLSALSERYGGVENLPNSDIYYTEIRDDEALPSQTTLYNLFDGWGELRAALADFD